MSSKKDERSKGEFLAEAEDILEDLGRRLAEMDGMVDSGAMEPEVVNAVFRGVHTLKGLSGMFGFEGIASLSHQLEHLLDALRLGRVEPTREAASAIYAALDRIKLLSEDISKSGFERSGTEDVASLIQGALSSTRAAKKKSEAAALGLRALSLASSSRAWRPCWTPWQTVSHSALSSAGVAVGRSSNWCTSHSARASSVIGWAGCSAQWIILACRSSSASAALSQPAG